MSTTQTEFNFSSPSPINQERLSGQNLQLYNYLAAGNTIHCMHPARISLKIGYTNSRISDLRKAGIEIYKRMIKVVGASGELVSVKEYSLRPFD